METLTVIIALALTVELVLHYRLHQRVSNLSSRLHHAEVNIARMKTDISAQRHYAQVISNDLRDLESVLYEPPVKE